MRLPFGERGRRITSPHPRLAIVRTRTTKQLACYFSYSMWENRVICAFACSTPKKTNSESHLRFQFRGSQIQEKQGNFSLVSIFSRCVLTGYHHEPKEETARGAMFAIVILLHQSELLTTVAWIWSLPGAKPNLDLSHFWHPFGLPWKPGQRALFEPAPS